MSNIFLRRNGLGLETIRSIIRSMKTTARIARVDLRRQPIPRGGVGKVAINWGTMASPSDYHVFNKPEAIRKTSNKGLFRKILHGNNLAPYTVVNIPYGIPTHKFPVVVRPLSHFGGKDLVVAHNGDELLSLINHEPYHSKGYYVSTLVPKKAEYRVFVAQGRVVYVVNKIPSDTSVVAWNVHQGGRFENVRFGSWDLNVIRYAVAAMDLTDLDFGAVDVIVGDDDNVYVLEVNTAPGLSSPYWIECVAKTFDYMTSNPDYIGSDLNATNWRAYVHPAISSEAQINITEETE